MYKARDKQLYEPRKKGLLNFNLDKVDNALRTISLNNPLLKAAILASAGYFGARALTPVGTRLLSPALRKGDVSYDDLSKIEQDELKHRNGLIAALLLASPTLINNFNTNKEWWGFKRFPDKPSYTGINSGVEKTSSAFNPYDPMQAIPLSTAKDSIMAHPYLTPDTKATAYTILNTFPQNAAVDGKSIIDRAVSSGIDFVKGGAFGAITAYALGLPNPYSTALITGTLNTLL